ncbi:MAG: InlB B-repeat-containing protein [Ruminococcus sp.]|nr:InlB B-repeat-containing protein [Ruminococcus sp.]
MNSIFKKITAVAASAAIAFCSLSSFCVTAADTTEEQKYTIHFDLSEEGVSVTPNKDGSVPEIKDVERKANGTYMIPYATLSKDGYVFSGWTEDNIRGYEGGDIFRVADHDVTLKPVWADKSDGNFHKVIFRVDFDGEIDTEAEKNVPAQNKQNGRFVTIPLTVFFREGYKQSGWTTGDYVFAAQQKMIVHDEDIILRPNWKKIYMLNYSVGDADRINGITHLEFENAESFTTNLQNNSRFSRNGFKIKGWHCEEDGLDYEPNASFVMPSHDVTMTPIWDPINYVITFSPSNSSSDDIIVRGLTDTKITVPDCTVTKEGYTFSGWKFEDTVLQPGEEYLVEGLAPGLGYSFKAVWNKKDAENTEIIKVVINVVDKKSGELLDDVYITASNTIYSADGSSRNDEFPVDTVTDNPKTIDYQGVKDFKSTEVKSFSIVDNIYNGHAYKLDEKDIVTEIDKDTNTAYYTVKLEKKSYPDDVKPYSYVFKTVDKETGELVNNAVFTAAWNIVYDDGKATGPVQLIDTSAANPMIISYEKYKNAATCTLTITEINEESDYTFSADDVDAETDEENNITTYTVKLTKKSAAEISPYSYVIKAVDKGTGKPVSAVFNGSWHITYLDTGKIMEPTEILELSTERSNPLIIRYEATELKKYVMTIDSMEENELYSFDPEDIEISEDEEKHITTLTIKLTNKGINYGDVNCDGTVDMADAVLIMQAISNPNKYGVDGTSNNRLTASGRSNADVDQTSPGMTSADALAIQKYLLGAVETLPIIPKSTNN